MNYVSKDTRAPPTRGRCVHPECVCRAHCFIGIELKLHGEKNNKKLKDVSLMRRCLPENWNQKFN